MFEVARDRHHLGALEDGGRRNPHLPGGFLSHAVHGYFLNGGGRCYVTRVAPIDRSNGHKADKVAAAVQLPSRSSKAVPSLTIKAQGDPTQDIEVEVQPPGGDAPPEGSFTLKIKMMQMTTAMVVDLQTPAAPPVVVIP